MTTTPGLERGVRQVCFGPLAVLVMLLPGVGCFAPDGPHPLWSVDASSLDNPLPDDRLVEGGHVRLRDQWFAPLLSDAASTFEAYELFDGYTRQNEDLDGFGTLGSVFVRFSSRPDGDLADTVRIVSLDGDEDVDATVTLHPSLPWAAVEPRMPLTPRHRYAVTVLAGDLADGQPLVRGPDFWTHAQEDPDLLADVASAAGRAPDDVLLAQPFTTTDPTVELFEAAELVRGRVPDHTFDAPRDDRPRGLMTLDEAMAAFPEDAGRLVAAGHVGVGVFRPLRARGADRVLDLDVMAQDETEDVEIIVVTPDPAVFPAPWPCVVAQHGFNGDNRFAIRVARELNEAGMLVIGMDAVSHGLRGTTLQFFNVEDVRVARDNFRQTALDLVQLATLCGEGMLDVDGDGRKDTTGDVGYFGHSMGAIIGTVFAAIDDRVHSVVLNAPGGGLTRIFVSEGLAGPISLLTLPALGLEWGDPAYDEVLPLMMGAMQPLLDSSDPLSFARLLRGRERMLVVEGIEDPLVPNAATENLIEAVGLLVPEGELRDENGLRVAVRINLDEHVITPAGDNVDIDAHNTHFAVESVRLLTAEFLRSHGTVLLDSSDAP